MGHPAYGVLRPVTRCASVLLANNPSPMTLDGTNSWVLRDGPEAPAVVIDPGPDDEEHLTALAAVGPVAHVLLTHRHPDHTDGARRLAELTGAPVHAQDPQFRIDGGSLDDGDVLRAGGLQVRVLVTPGHSSDSVCLQINGDGPPSVLTGDTILGRGTTVLAQPDGRLGDYLTSLYRLAEFAPGTIVLPGHGPELPDLATIAREYLAHRGERLDQIRAALDQLGAQATPRQVVEHVYADVDRELWDAAEWSVRAQLAYLRDNE